MRGVLIIGASVLLAEQFQRRLREHNVQVVVVADRPADLPTPSLAELCIEPIEMLEPIRMRSAPGAPPWRNDQPWLTRKKKGRS